MARPTVFERRDKDKMKKQQQDFESLCSMQCTLQEIAEWFRCSQDTVERWVKASYKMSFADAFKKYSARGRISLRRAQFKLAEKSPAMAIFLGKQYLGQRDSIQYEDREALNRLDEILIRMRNEADTETE